MPLTPEQVEDLAAEASACIARAALNYERIVDDDNWEYWIGSPEGDCMPVFDELSDSLLELQCRAQDGQEALERWQAEAEDAWKPDRKEELL